MLSKPPHLIHFHSLFASLPHCARALPEISSHFLLETTYLKFCQLKPQGLSFLAEAAL